MKTRHILLSFLLLAAAVPAQRLIFDVNGTATCRKMTGVRDWFCLATQAPATQPLLISAIEFPCVVKTSLEYGIWSVDATTGTPGKLLASGKIQGQPHPIWQGGPLNLSTPLFIQPGTKFFVGQKNPDGDLSIVTSGSKVSYHFLSGSTWRGPYSSYPWGFRLYSPGGTGVWTPYGKAKGTASAPLALTGTGWPNLGNPVAALVTAPPPSTPGLLLLGRHNPGMAVGPLGTVYVMPVFSFIPLPAGTGYAIHEVAIPNNPALIGGILAWQAWYLVATAPGGTIHTGGLDLRIG